MIDGKLMTEIQIAAQQGKQSLHEDVTIDCGSLSASQMLGEGVEVSTVMGDFAADINAIQNSYDFRDEHGHPIKNCLQWHSLVNYVIHTTRMLEAERAKVKKLRDELGKYHARVGTLQDREAGLRQELVNYLGQVGQARAEESKARERAARAIDFVIQARSTVRDILYAFGNLPMDAQWQAAKDSCTKLLQESAACFSLEETK